MTDNRKIAKNTLMLYVRTLLIMLVSLYTSRVVLRELGASDFGIYNVVGGVVLLFAFINNAISSAVQRFLNFELGRKDDSDVNKVFCTSVTVMATIVVVVVILAETLGLWFFETQLNIPAERMTAARWVYQFSIISCCMSIIRVPYNAAIIAYEKMSFYAWLSIIEAVLKLGIAVMLCIGSVDKLILYAGLMTGVTIITNILYQLYCRIRFRECVKLRVVSDRALYRRLLSFSGWSMAGAAADIGNSQGINMLINIFCSVIANAAVGVANQLSGTVYNLIRNFQIAFRPQIVKHYAAGEISDFRRLVYRSSKFSFFLLFFLSFPIMLNMDFVLGIWLKSYPALSGQFAFWTFMYLIVDAMSAPLWISVQATGRIRNYQIILSLLTLSNLPVAFILLKTGAPVVWVFVSKFIINIIAHFARLVYLHRHEVVPMGEFNSAVNLRVLAVCACTIPVPLAAALLQPQGWIRFLTTGTLCVIMSTAAIFLTGLTKDERKGIIKILYDRFKSNN